MIKTRIAPSPTGDPHVGTAYQALFNLVFARQHGGRFIVRIEDTDRSRFNPESQRRILKMLDWIGLHPDESPIVGGPSAPYIQTERAETHRCYAFELIERGHAYRAFDTPEELEARRKAAEAAKVSYRGYDRRDRQLTREESNTRANAGEPFVVRLKAPLEGSVTVHDHLRGDVVFAAKELDDKVLLKADGLPTYHLAAMSDDHDMGVTHVIRAEEWLTSTPIHKLIIQAMGWQEPEWIHTPLLRNPDKYKLSKRKSNTSVESYRAMGIAPEALINYLGMMAFSMPDGREVFGFDDLVAHFSWDRVGLTGPVFDLAKLTWLNGKYIREVFSLEAVTDRAIPFLEQAGFDCSNRTRVQAIVEALRPRFDTFAELPDKARYFFETPALEDKANAKLEEGRDLLRDLLPELERTEWTLEALEAACKGFAERKGAKLGAVMQPLRAATTGRLETPGMFEVLVLLGKVTALERIQHRLIGTDRPHQPTTTSKGKP